MKKGGHAAMCPAISITIQVVSRTLKKKLVRVHPKTLKKNTFSDILQTKKKFKERKRGGIC